MAVLKWQEKGKKYFKSGISKVVLFPMAEDGNYGNGVAWSGVTAINETHDGAEETELWADNEKYGSIRSAEKFNFTIEAYQSPEEFDICDGSVEIAPGVYAGQQDRKPFGLAYRSEIGNDIGASDYEIHLVYNATAAPSDMDHSTTNDSVEAATMSWECSTTAERVPGLALKPLAHLIIDSRKATKSQLTKLEDMLYGSADKESKLPSIAEVVSLMKQTMSTT